MILSLRGTVARAATVSALTIGLMAAAPAAHAEPSARPSIVEQTSNARSAAVLVHTSPTKSDVMVLRKARAAKQAAERASKRAAKRIQRSTGRVMGAAASRSGARYVYGGSGPWAFDCSGFTRWVYQRAGKSLPRTSGAQAGATRRIARRDARRGDLVFFHNGGRVYHVGIFAGGNSVVHASRPGVPVGRARIWTNQVFFGRVR